MDTDGSDSLITELQQAARGREECLKPEHGDGRQGSMSCCEHIPVEASVSTGPMGRDSVVGPDTQVKGSRRYVHMIHLKVYIQSLHHVYDV